MNAIRSSLPTMAKQNQQPKYLLGLLDESITEKHVKDVSWLTNKIGGEPNWIHADIPTPRCNSCQNELPLVVQVYCPLEGSPYHRCLYIFGCINPCCWNNSASWVAIRSQRLSDSPVGNVSRNNSPDDWLENSDVWGEEDNGNQFVDLDSFRPLKNNSSWETASMERRGGEDAVVDSDGNNVINTEEDDDGQNRNVILPREAALSNLDMNEAGNGLIEGAVGNDPSFEASAEVESPDEGTITIETPDIPEPETVAVLFAPPSPCQMYVRPIFKSSFLAVVDEPPQETLPQLTEHERELLTRYQKTEGLNFNELYNRGRKNNGDVQGMGEHYEKSFPRHGDRMFQKLKTRLTRCPEQLLRYSRDVNSGPLFVGLTTPDMLDCGKCEYCGDNRSFELELMPQLIDTIRLGETNDPAFEFGAIALYTCRSSCWKEGDTHRVEHAVLQPDPDSAYYTGRCSSK